MTGKYEKVLYWVDQMKIPEGIRIPYLGGKWYGLLSKIERKVIRKVDINDLGLNDKKRETSIVVSLTSFPGRIHSVHLAIKSLFMQSCKPDRILLWLSKEQFPEGVQDENLLRLQKKGLEIRYCDDLKSHKKYYYVLQQEKDSIVITYDDDLIYPRNSIEMLMKQHKRFPKCVICNRGMEIVFDGLGNVRPYSEWKVLTNTGVKSPSNLVMPSTGGGTLYPPNMFGVELFNLANIKKLAWTADDLWMKAMELYYEINVVKTRKYHRTFTVVEKEQKEKLSERNCGEGENNKVVLCLQEVYQVFQCERKK